MPFDGPDGYRAGLETLERILAPRRPPPIPGWAAQYRVLPAKSSAEPGRWKNERIPFLAGVMDALDPRHPAPVVVFVASAQVGKSECGLNWIGRTIHKAPGSFLALFPTDKVARKWVRTKLEPMLAACPELRALVPPGRRGKAGDQAMATNTVAEKHYPGGFLLTGSAGVADDVASISLPYLLLEELDRFPAVLEGEGDPVELALRRLATFARSKAFANSTPTTAETSRIWPMWLASTMDRYYVPCVHCGHMQYLRWSQIVYGAGKPDQAAYLCEHDDCARAIEERHKPDLLANGQWRSTHPEREGAIKGFHVNGLYTPIGLGDSWGKHAAAWERAKGSDARVQVFMNARMGETHKGERKRIQWEEIKRRAEPYKLRTIPKGTLILTSFTDVQADRLETQILGHGRGERIVVIDYVVHYGDTTRLEPTIEGKRSVWQDLDDYLMQSIENSFNVPMRLSVSLVDANYLPDTVRGFTRPRRARGIYASRGSKIATRQAIGRPTIPDVKRRGKTDQRGGAEQYELGVSGLKHWLFDMLRADEGTPDAPVLPSDRHFRFSTDLPDEYFRQLTAETWDPKDGWVSNYHRNEALDTMVGARAAAMHHSVAVHRLREPDWQRLEQLYETNAGEKPKAPELGKDAIATRGGFLPTAAPMK